MNTWWIDEGQRWAILYWPYCKKLTSHGQVVQVVTFGIEISGRIDAGEMMEFLYEMCLVEIAAVEGDVGPSEGLAIFQELYGFLKFKNTGEHFGLETDAFVEGADEVLVADARFLREPFDGKVFVGVLERLHGEFDVGVGAQLVGGPFHQKTFEQVEFVAGCDGIHQLFLQVVYFPAPDQVEFHYTILQFFHGEGKKRPRPARPEPDAHHRRLTRHVNDQRPFLLAGNPTAFKGPVFILIGRIE